MALNKDILGQALSDRADSYNNQAVDTTDAAAMAAYRLAFWKAIADEIIKHFKTAGVLKVPGAGLAVGASAVTGMSVTGTIE